MKLHQSEDVMFANSLVEFGGMIRKKNEHISCQHCNTERGAPNTAGRKKQKVVFRGNVSKILAAQHHSERKERRKEYAQAKATEPLKALMFIYFG